MSWKTVSGAKRTKFVARISFDLVLLSYKNYFLTNSRRRNKKKSRCGAQILLKFLPSNLFPQHHLGRALTGTLKPEFCKGSEEGRNFGTISPLEVALISHGGEKKLVSALHADIFLTLGGNLRKSVEPFHRGAIISTANLSLEYQPSKFPVNIFIRYVCRYIQLSKLLPTE